MQIGYILIGLALGSFGWLLYRAGLTIVGAVVGAGFGGAIAFLISGAFNLQNTNLVAGIGILLGIVLGIVLIKALLTYFFFATGASLGAAVAMQLSGSSSSVSGVPQALLVAFCGLVGGLLLVYLRRYVIALVAAVAGAIIFSMGLPDAYKSVGMIVALVVFIAAQVGLVKRFVNQEAFDARTRHTLDEEA